MSSTEAVVWLVATALGIALAGFVWNIARAAAQRRARRLRYRQASQSRPQRLSTQPGALQGGLHGGMGPERAAMIRREAEDAALRVARGEIAQLRSPHPDGSAEHVLWIATYHLTLTELAEAHEAAAAQGTAAAEAPAPQAGRR